MRHELQRADFWKRLSAFMFDTMMIILAAVGVAAIMALFMNYDTHYNTIETIEAECAAKYGINTELTAEEYELLSAEENERYLQADAEFGADQRVVDAYNKLLTLTLLTITFSLLTAYVGLEFVVPIFLGHGRTFGKKIFGLAVMRTNGVKIDGQAHFIRSIIGKYTMETMVPVYIILMIIFGNLGPIGTVLLILFLIFEIAMYATTRTRSTIHDLVSDTVVVDMASQMIFESYDDLMAYKTRLHEEEVNKKEY